MVAIGGVVVAGRVVEEGRYAGSRVVDAGGIGEEGIETDGGAATPCGIGVEGIHTDGGIGDSCRIGVEGLVANGSIGASCIVGEERMVAKRLIGNVLSAVGGPAGTKEDILCQRCSGNRAESDHQPRNAEPSRKRFVEEGIHSNLLYAVGPRLLDTP